MIQKCKRCKKVLGAGNKSGLCSHHYRLDWHAKRNIKIKKELKTLKDLERRQGINSFICLNPIEVKQEAIKYIKAQVSLKIFLGITKEDTK